MTTPIRSAAVLNVRDVVKAEAFYSKVLGFRSDRFWGDPPAFCIVRRGDVTIFLDQRREPGAVPVNQHWAAYVYVDDVDALHAEVVGNGAEIVRGLEDNEYGCRDFDVRDIDGHLICFGMDLHPSADGPGL